MNKEEIYSIWAPKESPWSRWVKPVLFAYLDSALSEMTVQQSAPDISWGPSPGEKMALVLDLPGAEGVLAGVILASQGYRPIPLYNAVPLPFSHSLLGEVARKPLAAVDVLPILSALRYGADQLARTKLPVAAPPAFLLDANRSAEGRKMNPDEFDNRSISFTTDFPSATFFAAHGIEGVMLIQQDRVDPQPDLAHSFRRWQDAGFKLERKCLNSPEPPERFEVSRPPWYGAMFQRAISSLGFRRAGAGGFGAWVPESSASG